MTSDIFEGLFGSRVRARVIRFFLFNTEGVFSAAEVAEKNRLQTAAARSVLESLLGIGLLKQRSRNRKKHYEINKQFPLLTELFSLVVAANRYPQCKSFAKIRTIGDVKLALVGGTFLNNEKSKADLLLVANNVSKAKVRVAISNIEAEVGREVRYVLMTTDEFKYRMEMLDRFLIGFFESPHDEIINKIPGLKRVLFSVKRKK